MKKISTILSLPGHGKPLLTSHIFLTRTIFCFLFEWKVLPSAWRLGFLAKKFLGFLTFLVKILAKFARFCKIFQARGENSKKTVGLLGKKTKNIQDLGKRTKKNLGFLPMKNLGCLRFFPKILAIILNKVRKIFQDFSRSLEDIQENFWILGNKSKNNQDLGKRNKKVLHQSNTRSIDILLAFILENSKNGLLLCVLLSEP